MSFKERILIEIDREPLGRIKRHFSINNHPYSNIAMIGNESVAWLIAEVERLQKRIEELEKNPK